MASEIPLFERDENGLLHQVPPASAEATRAGRRVSTVQTVVAVLWTAAEEAARHAEEAAAAAALPPPVPTPADKLARVGLTVDELKSLLK